MRGLLGNSGCQMSQMEPGRKPPFVRASTRFVSGTCIFILTTQEIVESGVKCYFFAHISATPAPISFKLFPFSLHIVFKTIYVGFEPKKNFFHIKNDVKTRKFRRFFAKIAVLRPYLELSSIDFV